MNHLNLSGLLLLTITLTSCRSTVQDRYAIRDFRDSLRPSLTAIVSNGILDSDTSTRFIENWATDEELQHLGRSEHPILRTIALRAMLNRPKFNAFSVLMSHLDDTAMVEVEWGEWGTRPLTVSDYLIHESQWKTETDKRRTIDTVIMAHNYLHSAYDILGEIDPKPKYYPYVKAMLERDRPFEDIENILFYLAKNKKKEDIPVIRNMLVQQRYNWCMSTTSFLLMQDYPDSSYLSVLEKYGEKNLFRHVDADHLLDRASSFFSTVASYKNERSAKILQRVFDRKPIVHALMDTSTLKYYLMHSVWANQCPAYSAMTAKIRTKMLQDEKVQGIPCDTSSVVFPQTIRW